MDEGNATVSYIELIYVPEITYIKGTRPRAKGIRVTFIHDDTSEISMEIFNPLAVEWYTIGGRVFIQYPFK